MLCFNFLYGNFLNSLRSNRRKLPKNWKSQRRFIWGLRCISTLFESEVDYKIVFIMKNIFPSLPPEKLEICRKFSSVWAQRVQKISVKQIFNFSGNKAKQGVLSFCLLLLCTSKEKVGRSSSEIRCNPQKNKIIAQIATLHSYNITLRNHKKLYNPIHNKKICKHNIIQLFILHN